MLARRDALERVIEAQRAGREKAVAHGDFDEASRCDARRARFDADLYVIHAREKIEDARRDTVRAERLRARAPRDTILQLYLKKRISHRLFEAARNLRAVVECASTGPSPLANMDRVDGRGAQVDHVAASVSAAMRARWAENTVFYDCTDEERDACRAVIIENRSIKSQCLKHGWSRGRGVAKLSAKITECLERAADYFKIG